MSDPLDLLIEREQAKLRVLEAEVAARKQRIQTLRSMMQNSDLDAFLAEKIKPAPNPERRAFNPPIAPAEPSAGGRRKHGEVKRLLLSQLNKLEPTHLNDLIDAMARIGIAMDNKRMRAEMWAHSNSGLVKRQKPGWFTLTDEGEAFLEGQKGETAVGAAVSGATASADDEL
jgi:hypothetical protein